MVYTHLQKRKSCAGFKSLGKANFPLSKLENGDFNCTKACPTFLAVFLLTNLFLHFIECKVSYHKEVFSNNVMGKALL